MSNRFDEASGILRATNDGDDLSPEDLGLVQYVVNNGVESYPVRVAWDDLQARVHAGYQKPWLHGIEHLTRDHEGYVSWKGHVVDHWSGDLPYSKEGKAEATELARRCRILEERGEDIRPMTVVWRWTDEVST